MKSTSIDLSSVNDWSSFHDLFERAFAFPRYYGRNMNAWIDCMEECAIGDSSLRLDLRGMDALKIRCPDIYEAINECCAFINYRSSELGRESIIALSYGI